MGSYTFQWRTAWRAMPELLQGALVTLELALVCSVLCISIGVSLALLLRSQSLTLKAVARSWVELARNTPSLFQIYFIYFGLGSFGLQIDSYVALIAGIAFNGAGYLAETFNGGLNAIPQTQSRAARSLGMGRLATFWYVVLPQLLRIVFHPMTNQIIWTIQLTALGVVVGVNADLSGVAQELNTRTFRTFEFFLVTAVLFYLISKLVMLISYLTSRYVLKANW